MRDLLLNAAASLTMAALLLILARRALRELPGLTALGKRLGLESASAGGRLPGKKRKKEPPAWLLFLLTVVVLWLWVALAYLALPRSGKSPADFIALWRERFTVAGDAPHYLYLAEHGYAREGEKINLIVFYPLYPFLTGLLGRVLGGRYALAGMLLSQGCYGLSGAVLWRIARRDTRRPWVVMGAYWLYPQAFFAMGVFTEGLFLLLSLLCLCALREERWSLAGVTGFLCLLCRAQGMALIPAFLYAAWHAAGRSGWKRSMLWGLALPLGWGVYLLLNRLCAGSWFAFRYYESIRPWWQTTQWLGRTVAQQVTMALAHPWLGKIIYWPQFALYFLAAALLFAAARRRLPTEHLVYSTAYLGLCYLAGWLISGGRYMLGCAGLFLSPGRFRRRWTAAAVLVLEALCCAWFTYQFMDGQSIM